MPVCMGVDEIDAEFDNTLEDDIEYISAKGQKSLNNTRSI
jgi:hypothetical protein